VLHTLGQEPSYAEHPAPTASQGRTLVRVTAAPVVPLDLLCATGTSYFGAPPVPYVPGVQGVGVVTASTAVEPGTRVWFATSAGMAPGDGSLAEQCSVADDDLVPVTEPVDDAPVAALGLSAVAGWMALTWRGRFRAGDRVLVLGGGGAVGQVAIAAARLLGAARVVAVARSEAARSRAEAAGAEEVVEMTADPGVLAERLSAVGGEYDVVVDPVFGAGAAAAARSLAVGGRLVNLGGSAGDQAAFSSALLRSRSAEILGYTNNALTPKQRAEAITEIVRHAAAGKLGVAHEVVPLAGVSEAWQRQQAGEAPVRLVLVP
jgi:NADPH:quinone reductase-like Zn-dependent oxidoreductase